MATETVLLRHAQRFGTEGVIETAVESRFSVERLASLIEKLDAIEYERDQRRFKTVKKHRLTYEERAKRALGISDEEDNQ